MSWNMINNMASASQDGMVTTTYSDDYMVQGYATLCQDVITLAAGSTTYFLLDLSAVPETDAVFMLPILIATGGDEAYYTLYEGTSWEVNDAVEKVCVNPNRVLDQGHDFTVHVGAEANFNNITTKGTVVVTHSTLTSGVGVHASGGEAGGKIGLLLDRTKNYLFELVNTDAGAVRFEYDATLYQIKMS